MNSATSNVNPDSLLGDLNDAQREAVVACSGPVVIIAGAGTGKTRVISRRAAYAIATDVVPRDQVLLVTFTDKAATEMRERLSVLGLTGVLARTFHAQARSILMHFWSDLHAGATLPEVATSKVPLLIPLIRNLPGGYRFTAPKDLATEIEWAKARMISPNRYATSARGRETPIPLNLMARMYANYEQAKARSGKIDFDDMLTMTVDLLESNEDARTLVQSRKSWISVDEYQDTNPLQERLLRLWLGDSRDLCVVGDEDQTIYTFTGADPAYLTSFASRWPGARTIELSRNYRSSPQVLSFANRLIAASGRSKRLEASQPAGPEPEIARLRSDDAEVTMIATRANDLISSGISPSQIAVLVRTNAQLPLIEQALSVAKVPYLVKGGLFFARPEVREAVRLLRGSSIEASGTALRRAIERLWLDEAGYDPSGTARGEEARSRAASFATLLGILSAIIETDRTVDLGRYLSEIEDRTNQERSGANEDGVNLLTYHRAKGLEWDAVFLPSLEEGLLPIAQAIKRPSQMAEERRLLYVGITRARQHLILSYAETRLSSTGKHSRRSRSRFLDGLGSSGTVRPSLPAHPAAIKAIGEDRSTTLKAADKTPTQRVSRTDDSATNAPSSQRETPDASGIRPPIADNLLVDVSDHATTSKHKVATPTPPEPMEIKSDPVYIALIRWRTDRARAQEVPAYVIAPNQTLEAITLARPSSSSELSKIHGLGPTRISRYGQDILDICAVPHEASSVEVNAKPVKSEPPISADERAEPVLTSPDENASMPLITPIESPALSRVPLSSQSPTTSPKSTVPSIPTKIVEPRVAVPAAPLSADSSIPETPALMSGPTIELTAAESIDLPTTAPFNFRLSLWKPSHFPSRLEWHSATETWRTLRLMSGRPVAVCLTSRREGTGVEAQIWAHDKVSVAETSEIEARLRVGYGLDVDLAPFYGAVITDSVMASGPITRLYGMRPSCPETLFEILVISLLLQNTTVARSAKMLDTVCQAFGDEVSAGGHLLSVFADPRRVAATSESFLREQCRIGYRAKYLVPLAEAFASGSISDAEIAALDTADAETRLRTIPGVGPYSARVALARYGGTQIALDVWNTKILSDFLFEKPDASAEEVRAEADRRWGRHQALGALYVVEDRYMSAPLSPIA